MKVFKLMYSHWTSTKTSLVAGAPIPLLAVHLNSVALFLLKLINGMVTTFLSEILVHVIVGVGLPSTMHLSVTFPPSITVVPVTSEMLDRTIKKKRRGKGLLVLSHKKIQPLHTHIYRIFLFYFHCYCIITIIRPLLFYQLTNTDVSKVSFFFPHQNRSVIKHFGL